MAGNLAITGGKKVRENDFHKWPVYGKEEEQALLKVLKSGKWGCLNGTETTRFEKRFAEYQGSKHAIAVCNGSVALRVALLAINIKAGDEVIVPPYTFLATATSVIECNATPIFADIDPDTCNIDPKAVEKAITSRTKAIIPVHFAGLSVDMDAIMAIAKKHNLMVIEDTAHGHGAEYKGKRLGSIGHIGCFSCQSTKTFNSGEGGIITTSDDKLAETCRSVQNCGRVKGGLWYEHHIISGNYRLTEFQSAVLNCQLDRLEKQNDIRQTNGQYLADKIKDVLGIQTQKYNRKDYKHVYYLFMMRFDEQKFGLPRKLFMKAANAEGMPLSGGYFMPLYKQPLFVDKAFGPYTGYELSRPDIDYSKVSCPVTEKMCAKEGMWFMHETLLGTKQDMDDVAAIIKKIYDYRDEIKKFATDNPEAVK